MTPIEYSQTYSAAERWRFVVLGVLIGALTTGMGKLLLFPALARFADIAPCRAVLGINGATLLWFGTFVGVPLLAALVTGVWYGRAGMRILRAERFPSPGARTLRPIRVIRGTAAKRIGYLHLGAFVPFLALVAWGYAQASSLSNQGQSGSCLQKPSSWHGPP